MAKLQVSRLPDHSDPRWVAVEHILCVENFKGSHLKKNMFSLIIFKNNLSFYLFTWLCWVSCPRGICSLLQYSNFWLMHVGSSSRPRDRTPAPFIRSTESEPLNHQGSPPAYHLLPVLLRSPHWSPVPAVLQSLLYKSDLCKIN